MTDARFGNFPVPAAGVVRGLPPEHAAVRSGRTLFPSTVTKPQDAPRIFVDGHNHRKLGQTIAKGQWLGFHVYALTLEERATCPRTCHHWSTCYGNGMHWSRRLIHGNALEYAIDGELPTLQRLHPDGFAVRLHVLGDFYSVRYVELWRAWLEQYPALHAFGFTAWPPDTEIGAAVERLSADHWDRFAIRLSHTSAGPGRAVTLAAADDREDGGVICPAQTGGAANCASCGLCWAREARAETIYFMLHGKIGGKKGPRGPSPYKKPPVDNVVREVLDKVPGFVAQMHAEAARLQADLKADPRFQRFEALLKLIDLYEAAPAPAVVKKLELPPTPVPVKERIRQRIKDGASNDDLVREFRLPDRRNAQGYRVGFRLK